MNCDRMAKLRVTTLLNRWWAAGWVSSQRIETRPPRIQRQCYFQYPQLPNRCQIVAQLHVVQQLQHTELTNQKSCSILSIAMSLNTTLRTMEDAMSGYARVEVRTTEVRVRFERVEPPGPPGSFDELRDRFYRGVPSARWNQQARWMFIPHHNLQQVLDFCYSEFGPARVSVLYRSGRPSHGQPALW